MPNNSIETLLQIERLLTDALRNKVSLSAGAINPASMVRQLAESIAQKRFFWLGKGTYVPNRLIGHVSINNSYQRQDLECILQSPDLLLLLNQYLCDEGLQLFDKLKIEIQATPNNRQQPHKVEIEFQWEMDEEVH